MSADPYSDTVRRHFASAQHAGTLDSGWTASAEGQGMQVELAARCESNRLLELRFRAYGCPHFVAAADAFCEMHTGQRPAELEHFDAGQLMQTLGIPTQKTGRILVLEDAVRALAARLRESDSTSPETD